MDYSELRVVIIFYCTETTLDESVNLSSRLRERKLVIFRVSTEFQIMEVQPEPRICSDRPPNRPYLLIYLIVPMLYEFTDIVDELLPRGAKAEGVFPIPLHIFDYILKERLSLQGGR
jgi:hypothetical protein